NLPGPQPKRVTQQIEPQPQPLPVRLPQRRDRQLSRVVVGKYRLLDAVAIDHLAKIALSIEQAHTDDRNAQIAGSLELIARYIAESAGVNGQRFAQHEFHTEVRNGGQRGAWMGVLKPGGRLRRLPPDLQEILDALTEHRIGQQALDPLPRYCLQQPPGVMSEFPQGGVQLSPHLIGAMVP